jgi:prevent-host-death family protein
MPIIKPISDLRNKSNEVSLLAHSSQEPIYITKNGKGDLVVMSLTHYNQLQKKLEIYSKLSAAQAQKTAGDNGRPMQEVTKELREKLREER